MSREEAAVLSSAQRHTVRRQAEEAAVYRANPLLYLTSPAVQVTIQEHQLIFSCAILPSHGSTFMCFLYFCDYLSIQHTHTHTHTHT